MKVKQGFVSNSSSSSFVVAIDKKPKTSNELKNILFGNEQKVCVYGYDSEITLKTEKAAKIIFSKLKEINADEVINVIRSGYVEEIWDIIQEEFSKKSPPDRNDWQKKRKREEELAKDFCNKFINRQDVKGRKLFVCVLSDETTTGVVLEHGGVFNRVPHIRISHH